MSHYFYNNIFDYVSADGQFGYYATPNMTQEAISLAAKKAYNQARISSKHAVYHFNQSARPAHKGSYRSPFIKDKNALSAGELNNILLEAYNHLKVNDKIVSASSLCQIIETNFKFISSNGIIEITRPFYKLLEKNESDNNEKNT